MNPGFGAEIVTWLHPGDLLLYSRNGFFSRAIKIKTWSHYSHVETYIGAGMTHAARDSGKFWGKPRPGTGVGFFNIQFDGLVLVRRPRGVFNLDTAMAYARRVEGQNYDVWGLFRFFTIGEQSYDKQFCSETAVRLARAGGIEPFVGHLDADLVSPRDLAVTPAYRDLLVYATRKHDSQPERELLCL